MGIVVKISGGCASRPRPAWGCTICPVGLTLSQVCLHVLLHETVFPRASEQRKSRVGATVTRTSPWGFRGQPHTPQKRLYHGVNSSRRESLQASRRPWRFGGGPRCTHFHGKGLMERKKPTDRKEPPTGSFLIRSPLRGGILYPAPGLPQSRPLPVNSRA